jgi:aminodeoxychorismate lyase
MYYFLNGNILEEEKAKIPITDRGFLFGDGLFETFAMRDNTMLDFEKHIQRLQDSARELGFELQGSSAYIFSIIDALIKKNGLQAIDAYIKVIATRGRQTDGIRYASAKDPLLAVIVKRLSPYDAKYYREGFSLAVSSIRRNKSNPLYRHKMLNYFENIFAKEQASQSGADEALFLTEDNKVLEASTANLFAVIKDCVHTPPADGSILRGITRDRVISLGRNAGLDIRESDLYLEDLYDANGIFLTNSIMDVMPVRSIAGQRIGKGPECAVIKTIMRIFTKTAG